ncbi:PIG-L family deacetylase [Propionicicella superfundia]|uniref:PIG-L family deacetylase n=1 Tax=Propionicicella superfundia TaxID=348582 RepID=UPI0004085B18|nr:PIG-L family deacetylase [Propionicicella superfundia]
MTDDAWAVLTRARRVLFLHAHPDDETLTTGALLADLALRGVECTVVTATRGERGEVVAGAVATADARTLDAIRTGELTAALAALGVSGQALLGTPPARAAGMPAVRYRDSGMRWVRPGLAGPADETDAGSFSGRPVTDAVADLEALLDATGLPDVLVGYDAAGSYGHPDHVRAHEVAREVASHSGVPLVEIASEGHSGEMDDAFTWVPLPGSRERLRSALACYRTQFTMHGEVVQDWADTPRSVPGFRIRHVGGQDAVVWCRAGVRRAGSRADGSVRR